MTRKYVSYSKLSFFLSKLKTIFSDINHVHVVDDVNGLQNSLNTIQGDIGVLEQDISGLKEKTNYTILPITQYEYDALTTVDNNTLYIIEV